RWRLGVVIVAILAAKPLVWAFLLAEQTAFALSCFVIAVSVSAVYWGPTFALLHSRVSNEMRPMATAIFLFTFNLVGLGLGPTLIGLASSMVFADHGNHSLGLSLAVIQLIGVWGVWHYWQAMKTIERA
ncbi:MAG: MFS transporter, partial [Rhodobiaceae bacterium]|nr:MFS transporter [Rhodobiaceae bacterium]